MITLDSRETFATREQEAVVIVYLDKKRLFGQKYVRKAVKALCST